MYFFIVYNCKSKKNSRQSIILDKKMLHIKIGVMKAIITVIGSDKRGIIAKVSGILAENNINIVDISQTILSGNFVMMMMIDLAESEIAIDALRDELEKLGEQMGVNINVMNEKVFSAMHRI